MINDITFKPSINRMPYTRSIEMQKKYLEHRKQIKDKNICVRDHILNNIIKDNLFKITINKFPYDIDNIEHYLIWINPNYKICYETLYEYIILYFKTNKFYYFENSSDLKSILDIRHFHIFILK